MYHDDRKADRQLTEPAQKKPYSKPLLLEHGDVRELTRGVGFTENDFLTTRRHGD
jgi:hypothetical protein